MDGHRPLWPRRQVHRRHDTVISGAVFAWLRRRRTDSRPPQQVVVARRRQAAERVEQIGVGADEDARLALLHSAVDDLGGLVRLRHGDGGELLHHLFLAAAAALGILAPPGVAHDVGVDAARMDVDGGHAGAAQLLAKRVGEAADSEFGRAVSALVGHADQAEHARRVDDRAFVLLDEDRQERAGAVDHTVEVDVPQPVVVLGNGVQHAGGGGDAGIVEHRADRLGRPVAHLAGEVTLRFGVRHVEHPQQRRSVQRGLGLLEPLLVDVGDGDGAAVRRKSLRQSPADAGRRAGDDDRSAADRAFRLAHACSSSSVWVTGAPR